MKAVKYALPLSLSLALTALLITCADVPDYCGTGDKYDAECEFCYSSNGRIYPLC